MKKIVLLLAVSGALVLLGTLLAGKISRHRTVVPVDTHANPRPTAATIATPPAHDSSPATSPRILLERQCLALAEHDPLAAMDLALKNKLCADDPGLITSLMMQWASHDFDAAYEWTKKQSADAWRDDILAHLAYLRAQTDPLAAARIVVTDIPAGPAHDEAVISVLYQWALRDAEAARLWAETMADGPLRDRALSEVAGVQKTASPTRR
jgi:hypothetical protein